MFLEPPDSEVQDDEIVDEEDKSELEVERIMSLRLGQARLRDHLLVRTSLVDRSHCSWVLTPRKTDHDEIG